MTIFFRRLAAGCLTAFLLFALGNAAHAQRIDAIAAVVGDDIILYSELAQRVSDVAAQLQAQGTPLPDLEILQRQVLDRLILRKLQLQRARQVGIEVSELDVTEALSTVAQRNGVTVDQMEQAMIAEGVDFGLYRQNIRDELTISQLRRREVEGRISVSESDVDLHIESKRATLQEEYHLRHILISLPSGATPEERADARGRAEVILAEVRDGQDFAQAAATHSDGQQALEGGDLGWRTSATLPTMFSDRVPTMQEGEISDLIETRSGYHIIRLEGRRRGPTDLRRSEVKARHILISPNDLRDNEASQEEAQRIYEELLQGADFSELAERNSDDPGSADQGGDLGWQSPDAYVSEFQQQAERLRVGEISQPFRSPFGWHILQVQDRREKKGAPEGLRNEAREEIFQRKATEEYELWLRRLRDEAYVEYRL